MDEADTIGKNEVVEKIGSLMDQPVVGGEGVLGRGQRKKVAPMRYGDEWERS